MDFRDNLKRPGEGPGHSASDGEAFHKEETMKKFIYITVTFMLMLVFIGCASMTPEQRKEQYDLRSTVGNQPFVGGDKNLDARGMMHHLAY
jgi:hypothetical protein